MTWTLPKIGVEVQRFVERPRHTRIQNTVARTQTKPWLQANTVTYPVLVRPSYVLGGQRMRIMINDEELEAARAEHLQTPARQQRC